MKRRAFLSLVAAVPLVAALKPWRQPDYGVFRPWRRPVHSGERVIVVRTLAEFRAAAKESHCVIVCDIPGPYLDIGSEPIRFTGSHLTITGRIGGPA